MKPPTTHSGDRTTRSTPLAAITQDDCGIRCILFIADSILSVCDNQAIPQIAGLTGDWGQVEAKVNSDANSRDRANTRLNELRRTIITYMKLNTYFR